jgi:ribonuclease HII
MDKNFFQKKNMGKSVNNNVKTKSISIGIDEVGRGTLAGPVVAVATAILNSETKTRNLLKGIKDSKKLSPKKREGFYEKIIKIPTIKWGVGKVSEKVIDRINILEATKLAMEHAFANLNLKLKNENCKINFLLIDGNFALPAKSLAKAGINLPIYQKSIIKGDEKIFLIKLASVIAKALRDKIMLKYDKKYPKYGFAQHKGYGTKLHLEKLKNTGTAKFTEKLLNLFVVNCEL